MTSPNHLAEHVGLPVIAPHRLHRAIPGFYAGELQQEPVTVRSALRNGERGWRLVVAVIVFVGVIAGAVVL